MSALPPYRFLGKKRKGEGHPPDTLPQEGVVYQIQCQSVNTHRSKHRPGGAQLCHEKGVLGFSGLEFLPSCLLSIFLISTYIHYFGLAFLLQAHTLESKWRTPFAACPMVVGCVSRWYAEDIEVRIGRVACARLVHCARPELRRCAS